MKDLSEVIDKLKKDRDFLLGKFVNKKDRYADRAFIQEDITSILKNEENTEDNLINHKRLI